jgi:arylsulfatase A-like enzyme
MAKQRITRRRFMHATAAATGLAVAARTSAALEKAKRNVIVIVSDTMRRDALESYGGKWIKTPHLNAFAKTSVQCDNAFIGSFPTVPARHDLLTGQYTFTFKPWSPLDQDTVTLQDVLRSAGVYTAMIVDTPHPFRPDYDYQRNFDHFHINRGQEGDPFVRQALPVKLPCDPKKLREGEWVMTQYLRNVARRKVEEDYFCARTLRDAADWLDTSHRRQPFFLYVDTFDPHEPWDPPKSYVDKYDPDYDGEEVIYPRYDRWRDFLSEKELKHCRALYAGEASMVDRWVGHLLDKIEKLGLYDNTLMCFLADHGFYLGEHDYIGKALIRDTYQSLPMYSEVCRVPWLVRFPGCKAGGTIDALVQHPSLGPTVLDFLGIKRPPSFAAPSLWPALQGKEAKTTDIAISAPGLSYRGMTRPHPANRSSITDGRWLFIYGCSGTGDPKDTTASVDSTKRLVAPLSGEKLAPELYDLDSDPGCTKNIIADHKDRARDLHRQFTAFLKSSPMRREHLDFFGKI